jgi:light-regulated signal transduction histidine kinase (bacteriophytochrome)
MNEEEALHEEIYRLNRSNETLHNFAYMAAHELQEPLRAMESFLNLLSNKYGQELTEEANEWLGETVAGTNRMRDLIQSLLTFSLADSQEIVLESVRCADVLKSALVDLKPVLDAKSVQVIVESDLPTVKANAILLSLLFRNLIGNSVKYCSERPIIKIRTMLEKDEFVFEIADNGIGFDMKYADRIFRPFERLHSKADYPGTGLGLALCKRIIERHHGKIGVRSAVNSGSTFSFSLPT